MVSVYRRMLSLRSLKSPGCFSGTCVRAFSSTTETQQGRDHSLVLTCGLLTALSGLALLAEEREIRKATDTLEKGSQGNAAAVSGGRLLDRPHLQNRLFDLLHPYVCSISHIDIVLGHEGTGRTTEIQRAIADVPGGALYVDLEGGPEIGSCILKALTGERQRSLSQTFRDFIRGGREAHGKKILEAAVVRYVRRHDRFPVVAFDNVRPEGCNLGSPSGGIFQLGRPSNSEPPSLRAVVVLDDADLEVLKGDVQPDCAFRVVVVDDATPDEALDLLQRHDLPPDLAQQVVGMVGGRMSHLQEAVGYWTAETQRWLSPMRANAVEEDREASCTAHFAEIMKILFWDLDRRLRISAGIALWPAATGHAPIRHQSPMDEDAARVLKVLEAVHSSPRPAAQIRSAMGEAKFLQLLRAQVLAFLPEEGPLHKRPEELVTFGSPAMRCYYVERLMEK